MDATVTHRTPGAHIAPTHCLANLTDKLNTCTKDTSSALLVLLATIIIAGRGSTIPYCPLP
eukprot:1153598-Pelagomonas_calceolata.AAC.2